MASNIFIPSNLVVGKLDISKIEILKSLPQFPTNKFHIGLISYYEGMRGFGFIFTNGQGFDKEQELTHLKEVFFHNSDWIENELPQAGQLVVFSYETSKEKSKAIAVRLLRISYEDYQLSKDYSGEYALVEGKNRGEWVSENIQSKVETLYRSTEEGRAIITKDILSSINSFDDYLKATKARGWIPNYLSSIKADLLTEEERAKLDDINRNAYISSLETLDPVGFTTGFTKYGNQLSKLEYCKRFNEKIVQDKTRFIRFLDGLGPEVEENLITADLNLNAELRHTMALRKSSPEWLKHPCVINKWNEFAESSDDRLFSAFKELSFSKEQNQDLIQYISSCGISHDSLKWETCIYFEDFNCFIGIRTKSELLAKTLTDWSKLRKVVKLSSQMDREDRQEFFESVGESGLLSILNSMGTLAERVSFMSDDPVSDELGMAVVSTHFKNTPLFNEYARRKWEKCKENLEYVVFDLEYKGGELEEFAYLCPTEESNVRLFESEKQLNQLKRAFRKSSIVVGHNIRRWDLKKLKEKEIELRPNVHIWDTLEIEILLNPCRYAYSLHTEHNAVADTKLADDLFWNQLFRIAQQPDLCDCLKEFLPKEIKPIIQTLQNPNFAEFFKEQGDSSKRFFQELVPLDRNLLTQLTQISKTNPSEPTLIIAPKDLWSRIGQIVPIQFPCNSEEEDCMIFDQRKVREYPISSPLLQEFVLRFCADCATPTVSNVARYLLADDPGNEKITIGRDILNNYLKPAESHIDCIDIDSFDNPKLAEQGYCHIYEIGMERQDRVHKQKFETEWTFADLLERKSRLPFSLTSSNVAKLNNNEARLLGINPSPFAANIWAERQLSGKILIYQNFKYRDYREKFLSNFNIEPIRLDWTLNGRGRKFQPLVQVRCKQIGSTKDFVSRVNPLSTSRQTYWMYQIALLNKIHASNKDLPIIYIVNDLSEEEAVKGYLKEFGYYIPDKGSGFRQLEYIGEHANGLVLISKERFINDVGSYQTDIPYCYVWDNMDIDRYKLIWDTLPFDGDYQETEDDDVDEKQHGTTARQCIFALCPIFEHYQSMVIANNPESLFYIMDPYFDDYVGIAKDCNAHEMEISPWPGEAEYSRSVELSKRYFKDLTISETIPDADTAMELIRTHFIGENPWRDYQIPLLRHMLEKKGDCVITLPTGGGKSVIFQAPAIFRSAFNKKLSLVVTPLRALMQDQVEELHNKGFVSNVDYLSGDRLPAETQDIYRRIRSGELSLLYITPERFRVRSFENTLLERMTKKDGNGNPQGLEFVIFDEAHCVSQWGQDFRPDYRYAVKRCIELRKNYDLMLALFSATVTSQVENDFKSFLPDIIKLGESANPVRDHISISFDIAKGTSKAKTQQSNDLVSRINTIAQYINTNRIDFKTSNMLVFCRTRDNCEEASAALEELCSLPENENTPLGDCAGYIDYFHAELDAGQRNEKYLRFRNDPKDHISKEEQIKILFTTKAFGMGMDIPNVHYLVHLNPPSLIEDYLQEVGRAGRDLKLFDEVFAQDAKIPALCITSQDDFKLMKDLLIRSQMSWSDLQKCKECIIEFITRFQTVEETRQNPIVVRYNVWQKDANAKNINDVTATKIAFQWLEKMGFIKQRYLDYAYISISMNEDSNPNNLDSKVKNVYSYLLDRKKRDNTLHPLADIRKDLKLSVSQIINCILECQSQNLLKLDEKIRVAITPRRFWESRYMESKRNNRFALRIAFNGMEKLLSQCKVGETVTFDSYQYNDFCKHLLDDFEYEDLIEETKQRRKKRETVVYMPWKEMAKPEPRGAVTIAQTFQKDILGRTGHTIFGLLRNIRGVNVKARTVENETIYHVRINNANWRNYLSNLEEDCLQWIYFVSRNHRNWIDWPAEILEYSDNGDRFGYLCKILSILKDLSYIEFTPITSSGIEIFTTDLSENQIDDGLSPDSSLFDSRDEFDKQEQVKKVRLACMQILTLIGEEAQKEFIRQYFLCRNYDDYFSLAQKYVPKDSSILAELSEKALLEAEKKIEGNKAQCEIYNQPVLNHINVMAGPGSGKTHLLTLRCARLIYREHVNPDSLLILAYNRAVVEELRNRLDRLFTGLGMSKIAHKLHVHTFHALAKLCMLDELDNVPTEQWEGRFLDYLLKRPTEFKDRFPNIEYILVDEFQDITELRLDSLLKLHDLYPGARFFTIGDINQSIYGFDRVKDKGGNELKLTPEAYSEKLNPQPYYDRLNAALNPVQLGMFTNYRSYQKILDCAATILPGCTLPVSAESLMEHEPEQEYVIVSDCVDNPGVSWCNDLKDYVESVLSSKDKQVDEFNAIKNIAVFFRTNSEVYQGYSQVKSILPAEVKIRIQGTSICEMWRTREFYDMILLLRKYPDVELINNDEADSTAQKMKDYLLRNIKDNPSWDPFLVDLCYTVVLNYLESTRNDSVQHTYLDLANYIQEIGGNDDGGQIYKIYEKHKAKRLFPDDKLTVILTTMHKVKGLEFDAVFITPSKASLPLRLHNVYTEGQPLQLDDLADIEEEKRLLFVAYTRAKKYLHVYKGEREHLVESAERPYLPPAVSENLCFESNPGMENYYLSYLADKKVLHESIGKDFKKDMPVQIQLKGDGYVYICKDNRAFGRLSRKSSIYRKLYNRRYSLPVTGFFVSEISIWTYEDSLKSDENSDGEKTTFSLRWDEEARKRGFIYLVQIAGMGKLV